MSLRQPPRGRSRCSAFVLLSFAFAIVGTGPARGQIVLNPTNELNPQTKTAKAAAPVKGLNGGITDANFSADGKKIVASADDGLIKVWNSETGEELATLRGHRGPAIRVAFSPDGRTIVSGGYDTTLRLWDAATGKEIRTIAPVLPEPRNGRLQPESLEFSPDGSRILCAGNGTVDVIDLATNKVVTVLRGHKGTVVSARYSSDGKRIVSGARDRAVRVWDAETGRELKTFGDNLGWVEGVAFSPDGTKVVAAVGSEENLAKVWDVESGKPIVELKGHGDGVMCAAFSPDGKRIVTGGADRSVRVWDAATGQSLFTIPGFNDTVRLVAFSPDGRRILAGAGGRGPNIPGDLKLWDAEAGALRLTLNDASNAPGRRRRPAVAGPVNGPPPGLVGLRPPTVNKDQESTILQAHRTSASKAWSVAFSPDGARIATGGEDQTLKVSDAHSGREIYSVRAHPKAVKSVAFSPDGKYLLSGGIGLPNLGLWNAVTGKPIKNFKGHGIGVLSVRFSPDGKRAASGGADATVKLWVAATGTELRTFRGHLGPVTGVAFSPDGSRIASASLDKTARIWNANTGKPLLALVGHSAPLNCIAFSPDGTRVVTGSDDKTLILWDATTGKPAATLHGHTSRVTSAVFSPDGATVAGGAEAQGSVENTIKIWDARTGAEIRTIGGTNYFVNALAFSPDGNRLAAACDFLGPQAPGVRVWTLNPTAVTPLPTAELADAQAPMPAPAPSVRPDLIFPKSPKPAATKPERIVLIPTAEEPEPATWFFTTTDPGAGWELPKFDASRWDRGKAGFCSPGHFSVKRNTIWRSKEIWLRATVDVPKTTADHKIVLRVGHDDDLAVYINGNEVYQRVGVSGSAAGPYREVVLDDVQAAFLRPGKNVIAARCIDTGGECAVDIGLSLAPKE